jgi:hypothetical protein
LNNTTSFKISDNRVVRIEGPEITYNLWKYMAARQGVDISMKGVGSRVLAATGICKRMFVGITKEGKEVDRSVLASFLTPEKSLPSIR